MRLRTLIAIAVTMCALPVIAGELPIAPAPRKADEVKRYSLRNANAQEAATAVARHFENKKVEGRVTFDVATNTVFVSARPDVVRQATDLLTALDKQPPIVVFSVLVLKVPGDFVEKCGLNVDAAPNANSWTLSPRELLMLTALIRAAKERGQCEVLTRPQISLLDNQTGSVHVGAQVPLPAVAGEKVEYIPVGFTCQLAPRVNPNGRLLLRTKAEITEQGAPVALTTTVPGLPFPLTQFVPSFNTQSVQTTNELKTGETLVTRVGETLVVITPTVTTK
jgi:type II secretory pathway component GspD/PulD (secretin)